MLVHEFFWLFHASEMSEHGDLLSDLQQQLSRQSGPGSEAVYLPPGLSVPKTSHWQKVGKQTMTTFRKFNLEEKNSDKSPQNNQDYRLLNLHSLTADLLLPRPTIFFT